MFRIGSPSGLPCLGLFVGPRGYHSCFWALWHEAEQDFHTQVGGGGHQGPLLRHITARWTLHWAGVSSNNDFRRRTQPFGSGARRITIHLGETCSLQAMCNTLVGKSKISCAETVCSVPRHLPILSITLGPVPELRFEMLHSSVQTNASSR